MLAILRKPTVREETARWFEEREIILRGKRAHWLERIRPPSGWQPRIYRQARALSRRERERERVDGVTGAKRARQRVTG